MSSIVRTGGSNIDRSADLRGLSTDTKPTKAQGDNVPHGSTWYNMDDCTKYMYNEDNDTWYNIPNGGGGTGDMQKSVYDPTNTVANAGGIDTYVGDEINNAKSEIITEVEGNIATTANNLIDDTVGWTNKNLLPITLDQLKAINTSGTWEDNVYTYRNITITVDIFNNLITGINVNGANTTGSVVFKLTDNFVYQLLSEDKYYISDGVDTTAIVSGSAYISVERKKGESGESHYLSTNNEERSTKFTVDYSIYDYYFVNIYIPNNSSINNAVFYPMIRRASISDDTYEPYTKTVKDEIFNLNSSVGNLKTRVGLAEGNIQTLNEIKANKSDLGTASTKNSTSVVTQSTDLVESGAVKDIVGWGNKNTLPLSLDTIKRLNTHGVWSNNTFTYNGIAFTVLTDSNGSITGISANNTATGRAYIYLCDADYGNTDIRFDNIVVDGYTYSGTIIYSKRFVYYNSGSKKVYILIDTGEVCDNDIFYPQREKGSTATSYEPYHASVEDYCASKKDVKDIVGWGNKNLLPNNATSQTVNGVTFTVNADGSVTANGTATERTLFEIYTNYSHSKSWNGYILSGCPSGGGENSYRLDISNVNTASEGDDGSKKTITVDTTGKIIVRIRIANGYTANNLTFYPMISKDGGAYEPYHASVEESLEQKCDNSVIGTVEDGTTASQAYAVGSHFIRNGKFCTVTQAISSGGTLTEGTNYTSGDVADVIGFIKEVRIGTFDFSTNNGFSTKNITFSTPFSNNVNEGRIAVFVEVLSGNASHIFASSVVNSSKTGFTVQLLNAASSEESTNRVCFYLAIAF